MDPEKLIRLARQVIGTEADAVAALGTRIGDDFINACELCMNCRGRIVVTGMGKSGHIAGKIAATLASTGTPAFFVHPGEASHGDLGMITGEDVVLALSYSGETNELITILPLIKRLGVPLISITGTPDSTLARSADIHLDTSVSQEACPLNLAPTASTTAALAMGDALAVALLETRGFTEEDFARSHPGGSLGRRLLLRVEDLMHVGDAIPAAGPGTLLRDALLEMTRKGFGMVCVVAESRQMLGVYTDGDLRRSLDAAVDLQSTSLESVMTRGGVAARPEMLAGEAIRIMHEKRITALPVIDEKNHVIGVIHMHDLLRAGIA